MADAEILNAQFKEKILNHWSNVQSLLCPGNSLEEAGPRQDAQDLSTC